MARGLLAVAFDFSSAHADEFHDWYDLEHLPERSATPGFGPCERWISTADPTHAVATYDLSSIEVLNSDAYKAIAYENLSPWSKRVTSICNRLLRFEGTQVTPGDAVAPADAGAVLVNAMDVSAEAADDFNAWYDDEHLPALATVPGTLSARRFKASPGSPSTHTYLALYHLENPQVTTSDAWREAIDTPWSARVRPAFENHLRIVSEQYVRSAG